MRAGSVVDITKHDVHLLEGPALCLREEEECPERSDDHPAGEEVPCTEAKGIENIGEGFCDGELGEPVIDVSTAR